MFQTLKVNPSQYFSTLFVCVFSAQQTGTMIAAAAATTVIVVNVRMSFPAPASSSQDELAVDVDVHYIPGADNKFN